MTTSRADLPVVVDRAAATPLAAQISAQVRTAVAAGVLSTGDRLPSTRDLAAVLGVSRTVVTTAYAQLFAEGWLEGRHGSGTYIANLPGGTVLPGGATPRNPPAAFGDLVPVETPLSSAPLPQPHHVDCAIDHTRAGRLRNRHNGSAAPAAPVGSSASEELINLSPGIPWAAGIEPAVWRRAWRHAGTRPPSFWPDPHGLPELRAELAAYLRRSRGLSVTPAHILVTRGVASGLGLLAAAVLRPGDKAGVEEPGYPSAREVLRRAGAEVVPCRVDAHGIVPDELPGDLRLLYTTPAHQYPLGGRLPVGRRQALIAWARRHGALVVEDDYDSEFRYDVGPLPALHSMDPDVIVYLGTAFEGAGPGVRGGLAGGRPRAGRAPRAAAPGARRAGARAGAARPARAAHLGRPGTPRPQDAPGVRPAPGRARRAAQGRVMPAARGHGRHPRGARTPRGVPRAAHRRRRRRTRRRPVDRGPLLRGAARAQRPDPRVRRDPAHPGPPRRERTRPAAGQPALTRGSPARRPGPGETPVPARAPAAHAVP